MMTQAEIKKFPDGGRSAEPDSHRPTDSSESTVTRRRMPDLSGAKKTLHQVILGIWILAGIVMVTGVWFVEYPLAYLAGEVAGSGIATGLMYHLYHCIDVELDSGEAKAKAHSKWNAMIRLVIEIAAVAGCCLIPTIINPITLLIGLFGRKIGAMMVPVFFDKERTGQMTEEDREQLSKYGRQKGRWRSCLIRTIRSRPVNRPL